MSKQVSHHLCREGFRVFLWALVDAPLLDCVGVFSMGPYFVYRILLANKDSRLGVHTKGPHSMDRREETSVSVGPCRAAGQERL